MEGEISKIEQTDQETSLVDGVTFISNETVTTQNKPIEEMLGSVTTYNNIEGSDVFGAPKNIQQLRTSARVFKKMKLDSALASPSVTTIEKEKKDCKDEVKEVKKPLRPSWSQEDKNIFFEALNEYGKDFEAIQQYINNKFKKKSLPDSVAKTKDQIRHFYYRTWHKVSKYLKFSDDIKKIAQELYALINYGELRKKVGSVSEKVCMKLNELIYRGTVHIRVKGKTIRIKTPMCRALRKLNELDEKHEDLKLPTRVLVELRPKNIESWLKVQFIAQNPRVKISLPLQKRVSALLQCMNERWKTNIARAHEKIINSTNIASDTTNGNIEENKQILSPLLRFTPKSNCSVEVPTINLSEYLTSHRICLNAYEERIGVKLTSEQLWQTTCSGFKGGGKAQKKAQKRQRNESTGEKSSDNQTTEKSSIGLEKNPENLNDVVDTAVNTILALQSSEPSFETVFVKEEKIEAKEVINENNNNSPTSEENKKLENTKFKNGWTLEDCGTLTIGELYLMFGHDSKLTLEYSWDPPNKLKVEQEDLINVSNQENGVTDPQTSQTTENPTQTTNITEKDENSESEVKLELNVTLQKLLSIAKLHYRKERVQCPCGHICGGPKSAASNRGKNIAAKANATDKNASIPKVDVSNRTPVVISQNCMRNVTIQQDPVFRRPPIYHNNGTSSEAFKAQLDSLQKMRPKYCNRRGRPMQSKHVVVERMLPLLPKPPVNGHSLVPMKVLSTQRGPRPIAPKITEGKATDTPDKVTENSVSPAPENSLPKINLNENETTEVLVAEITTINIDNVDQVITDVCIENTVPTEIIRDPSSPTSISNFLDLSIPNSDTNDLILTAAGEKGGITSFAGLLSGDNSCPDTTPLSSPSRLLKENEDIQWLNSEVNDYSLTSLLGHLESPLKVNQPSIPGDVTISQDIDAQFPSLLGENGVDFVDQFVDMAAQVSTEVSEIEQIANL